MEQTVECPACGVASNIDAFVVTPRRGDLRRERKRRDKMKFPPRPFMLRPTMISLYDVVVILGVALIADTAYHATYDLSMSGLVLFPIVFFWWRRSDVREIADRTLRVLPRARSSAMGLFEYFVSFGTVVAFFNMNAIGPVVHMVLYICWSIIVVQQLRFRHRALAPFRDVKLAWWQREEYMACFALLVWMTLVDFDSTHFIEVYYNNPYIEALVR